MTTGFTQYWIYQTVKNNHFKNKKFNIMVDELPNREVFIRQWNEKRRLQDGILFYSLANKIPESKYDYIRLYSYYYMRKPDFHVREIFKDDFSLWEEQEYQIRNIETVVSNDWFKISKMAHDKNESFKGYFLSSSIPKVFGLYDKGLISINSLIVFNLAFDIRKNIKPEKINIIELTKMKKYNIIFDKYFTIIEPFFNGKDWKSFLKGLF